MSKEIWMSQAEQSSWHESKAALEALRLIKSDPKTGKKLSLHQLNLALIEACTEGNLREALRLLDQGAQVNCRARSHPGNTPLACAIKSGHDELALEILRVGGLPPPESGYGGDFLKKSKQFDAERANGEFTTDMRRELSGQTLALMIEYAKSWHTLTTARNELPLMRKVWTDQVAMRACMKVRRYDLALEGFKAGVEVSGEGWHEAHLLMNWKYMNTHEIKHRDGLLGLLATPGACAKMDAEMCSAFFDSCVRCQDAELLEALMDAGLRPDANWLVNVPESRSYRHTPKEQKPSIVQPLLVATAALDTPALFDLVRSCPAAVNAAKVNMAQTPATLARVPVGRLLDLSELGIAIDACDKNKRNVTHLWALIDSEARSGWASVGARIPKLFEALDEDGKSGYQKMSDKLQGKKQHDFMASISRVEMREIRKEIGAGTPLPSGPKRNRI